ncbi:MAG TPA: ATP-binding protein [Phycisphaerae bacterium]|nr:ATP-binding protein [Phycisphaerae bacterium]
MNVDRPDSGGSGKRPTARPDDSAKLSQAILRYATRGLSRLDFLNGISQELMDFSGCDAVEIRLHSGELHYRWESSRRPELGTRLEMVRWRKDQDGKVIPATHENTDLERLCEDVARQRFDPSWPFFTEHGSFWTGDAWTCLPRVAPSSPHASAESLCVGGHYRSIAVIRFIVDSSTIGLLHLKSERPDYFAKDDVEFYEGIAQTVGLAVADRRAERALRERVKELTCLYGIAQIAEEAEAPLEETLHRIVKILPHAWQYPEIAAAAITLGERVFVSPGFRLTKYEQSAEIVIGGQQRGMVQVVYLQERPELVAGPFLVEEEKLIAAVAREVALIVERKEAAREKANLQQQLIHADRLATIGQLAAGVAHELNEPLGGILGFAQLARKCQGLPETAVRDIEKIITASLYAREIIKKLLVFARQMPARKVQVNLNRVVEEGLFFLEAHCAKTGTRVVRQLAPDLPEIQADPAQLKQVLVNLVVNAVQAMPGGGTLTVGTQGGDGNVSMVITDTGSGISEDILPKIFLPFFTTKDVSEGTGLGLAVVHGIVTSHGGTIEVQSRPGGGSRFEVRLPLAPAEQNQEAHADGVRR